MISLILATALTCQLCGDTRSMMEGMMNETAYELSMQAKQEAKRQADFVGPPAPPVVQPPTKRLSRAACY